MSTELPGAARFRELVGEALEPELVWDMMPMDLNDIRDPGMQALVALAASCKWNVLRKAGRPITLIARDGTKLQMPNNTSIRFSVFIQRLNSIIRHSQTVVVTSELIEKIIKVTKLDISHARKLREVIEVSAEALSAAAEIDDEPEPEPEPEPEYVLEDWIVHDARGRTYVSPSTRQRVWSDGHVDYVCTYCGEAKNTGQASSSHYGYHVRRGDVPPLSERNIEYGPVEEEMLARWRQSKRARATKAAKATSSPRGLEVPGWTESVRGLEERAQARLDAVDDAVKAETPKTPDLTAMVVAFQQLIDQAVEAAVVDLQQQLDAANAEIARLKSERIALRDLLQ